MQGLHRIQRIGAQYNGNGPKLKSFLNPVCIMSFSFGTHNLLGFPKKFLKIKARFGLLEHGPRIFLKRVFARLAQFGICIDSKRTLHFEGALHRLLGMQRKKRNAPISKPNGNRSDHRILNHTIDTENMKSLPTQNTELSRVEFAV